VVLGNPRDVLDRPAPPPDFTVRYGDHPDQVADMRLPTSDRPGAPLIIFIHGGFWRVAYDRHHVGPLASDLAERGYAVATIEYRRVGQPGGGWPGTFSDVAAAVAAVPDLLGKELAHRGLPAVDIDRPVLAGHSAGGQLALWYAAVAPDAVRGVLGLAPVADLITGHRLGIGDDAVESLLGGSPAARPEIYASADPMAHLPLNVPTVIVHGVDDDRVPIELSRQYTEAARRSGDDTTLVELAGVEHFALIDPLSTAWPAVLDSLRSL
jgi:dipeptidyl aminopeptidase/acylaminoacyl peptidase